MYTVMVYNELERILRQSHNGELSKLPYNGDYQILFNTLEDAAKFAKLNEMPINAAETTLSFNHNNLLKIMRKIVPEVDQHLKEYHSGVKNYNSLIQNYQHSSIPILQQEFIALFTNIETTALSTLRQKSDKLRDIIKIFIYQSGTDVRLKKDKTELSAQHPYLTQKIETSVTAFQAEINRTKFTYHVNLSKLKEYQQAINQAYEKLNNTLVLEASAQKVYGDDCQLTFDGEKYYLTIADENLRNQFAAEFNKRTAATIHLYPYEVERFDYFLKIKDKISEIRKTLNTLTNFIPEHYQIQLLNYLSNMEKDAYNMSIYHGESSLEFLEHMHTMVSDVIKTSKLPGKLENKMVENYAHCFTTFDESTKHIDRASRLFRNGIRFVCTLTGAAIGTALGLSVGVLVSIFTFPITLGTKPILFAGMGGSSLGYAGYGFAQWLTSFSSRECYHRNVTNFQAELHDLIKQKHDPTSILMFENYLQLMDKSIKLVPDDPNYKLIITEQSVADKLLTSLNSMGIQKNHQYCDKLKTYTIPMSADDLKNLHQTMMKERKNNLASETKLTEFMSAITTLYPQRHKSIRQTITITPSLSGKKIKADNIQLLATFLNDKKIVFTKVDNSIEITNKQFNEIFKYMHQVTDDAKNFADFTNLPYLHINSVTRNQDCVFFSISDRSRYNSPLVKELKKYDITPTIDDTNVLNNIRIRLADFEELLKKLSTAPADTHQSASFQTGHMYEF